MRGVWSGRIAGAALLALALGWGANIFLSRYYVTPILMYHHIDDRSGEWKLSVSPESFDRQMRFLKEGGYEVMDLGEYIIRLRTGAPISHKSAVVTFDDGYKDNHDTAMPILRKYGLPATVFVQVDGVGRANYMSQDEVKDLIRNGISIGSHTIHHGFLPDLSPDEKRKEIFDSKLTLEKSFGIPILLFSYPGGGFDAEARRMVIEAGYQGAAATHPGKKYPFKDTYALKRIRISRTSDNPIVFWAQLSGFYTYWEEFRG